MADYLAYLPDARRLRSYLLRLPLATRGLLAVLTAFYVAHLFAPGLVQWGALIPKKIRLDTLYRLNTYPLLHHDIFHFLLNALALVPLLERFESEHGTIVTFILFTGPFGLLPGGLYTILEKFILHLNGAAVGASVWVFLLLANEAMKQYKINPYFTIMDYRIPTWTTPLIFIVLVSFLVPHTSFLGHLCGAAVGYLWGLGYIRFLAAPDGVLRWVEGKLNLLGRLPHYVSVDQKTYGRPEQSSAPSSAARRPGEDHGQSVVGPRSQTEPGTETFETLTKQERGYVGASRRKDRSLEDRFESARRASEVHRRLHGRPLKVTCEDVENDRIYEEDYSAADNRHASVSRRRYNELRDWDHCQVMTGFRCHATGFRRVEPMPIARSRHSLPTLPTRSEWPENLVMPPNPTAIAIPNAVSTLLGLRGAPRLHGVSFRSSPPAPLPSVPREAYSDQEVNYVKPVVSLAGSDQTGHIPSSAEPTGSHDRVTRQAEPNESALRHAGPSRPQGVLASQVAPADPYLPMPQTVRGQQVRNQEIAARMQIGSLLEPPHIDPFVACLNEPLWLSGPTVHGLLTLWIEALKPRGPAQNLASSQAASGRHRSSQLRRRSDEIVGCTTRDNAADGS